MIQGLVSVIMLTKDPLQEYTQKAIEHLQASTIDYELILINRNTKWSVGTATNQGLEAAIGDRILLLCDDCFVEPDTLEQLRDELRLQDVGMVGPSLRYPSGVEQAAGLVMLYRKKGALNSIRSVTDAPYNPDDMGFLSGACMMFRRSVVNDLGGYATDCSLVGGDLDFCWRARGAGYTLRLVEDASAVHLVGSTRRRNHNADEKEAEGMDWLLKRWQHNPEYIQTYADTEAIDYFFSVGDGVGKETRDRLVAMLDIDPDTLLEQEAPDGSNY